MGVCSLSFYTVWLVVWFLYQIFAKLPFYEVHLVKKKQSRLIQQHFMLVIMFVNVNSFFMRDVESMSWLNWRLQFVVLLKCTGL